MMLLPLRAECLFSLHKYHHADFILVGLIWGAREQSFIALCSLVLLLVQELTGNWVLAIEMFLLTECISTSCMLMLFLITEMQYLPWPMHPAKAQLFSTPAWFSKIMVLPAGVVRLVLLVALLVPAPLY